MESTFYLIRDGIDDFAMIAIDQDGNGKLDELDTLTSADVGLAGFGDVLVLDDDWANLDGGSQMVEFHGNADFENVSADGEWRQIEIWMSEGGSGDSGIVYMGRLDDPDIFDDTQNGALSQEERDAFVIRNDQLRSEVSVVTSADASAGLRGDVEYVMQVSAEGSDQFSIDDNQGLYNTTLDVTDATVRVQVDGELPDGTVVTLFDVDSVTGIETLTLLFDDESQWDLRGLGDGTITFGKPCDPNTQGDLDGSGTVEFADFLVLSANFGSASASHVEGDVDCSGDVGFADFLILSANFGQSVGAEAANVPEPVGIGLAVLGVLGLFRFRSRRTHLIAVLSV